MTNPKRYPRGSEWRRWDLHIHTPHSVLNSGFGDDFDSYAEAVLRRAVDAGIAAIGVTDYFSIEGYKRLRDLVGDSDKLTGLLGAEVAASASQILLIPNVELRSSVIVRSPSGADARINFHVLFSDELAPEDIDDHFLRELQFTAESAPDSPDERHSLTLPNLERLGRTLKTSHEKFAAFSDLHVGMMNAVVSHEDVSTVLDRQQARFKDRVLFVVPADEDLSDVHWDGQGHLVRKLMLQKAHMLFSSNSGTRDFALGRKHASVGSFEQEFKSRKPCIHGSDAHKVDDLFVSTDERFLWIKADPTFQGLRQLLYEPENRVYIGEEPPFLSQVSQHPTKYMTGVGFVRTDRAAATEQWFSGEVPLNAGLIAIIGNKGSGKSALADVLGLLADSKTESYFSFLNDERFLSPKRALGSMFDARLAWQSGESTTRRLSESVDASSPERVKYIPQKYLEVICSELRESPTTEFDQELEQVIFSHVEQADRLGKATLPDLLAYRTAEKEESITQLLAKLADVNRVIVALESQSTEAFRKELVGTRDSRRSELAAHDNVRPTEVVEPSQDLDEQAASNIVKQELEQVVSEIERLDKEIDVAQQRLEQVNRQIAAAERFQTRIRNLRSHVEGFHAESVEDGGLLGLDTRDLISLQVNDQPVVHLMTSLAEARERLRTRLDGDLPESLVSLRTAASELAKTTRLRLDEPNRRHQEYLHELALWTKQRAEIEGSPDTADSLLGLEKRLADLDELPGLIRGQEAVRLQLTRDIFEVKEELLADYRQLYSPVQDFIDNHPVSQELNALQFAASMAIDGLVDGILSKIHHGRRGSFQGEQEGRARLRTIIAGSDFSPKEGVEAFLSEVHRNLTHDVRDGDEKPTHLRDQLRQGSSPETLYDFLYGLSYLRPRFELLWQEKSLDQLSPGERGTLLLVFYLLIDRRDIPLVIDQPEENLDNQTITALLVPAIKYAKVRRQIVIVTHNPNLAVVCDADQVIHAHLDKTDGNRITYTTGSIEDPRITQLLVDVLEGTKPAFDLRDAKYEILERAS